MNKEERRESYRNIMNAWYILSGIEPFKEYCEKQINKLINSIPEDEIIIREEYRKVFGGDHG